MLTPTSSFFPVDSRAEIERAKKLIFEAIPHETKRAYEGAMRYWKGWCEANGWLFTIPLDWPLIVSFVVQHWEGLPDDVEEKLVKNGLKRPGRHKFSTIVIRIRQLQKAYRLHGYPSPLNSDLRTLLNTLSKQSTTTPKGKAIRKKMLLEMLQACDEINNLIGTRDAALLTFGWASGGRRASEIVNAKYEDLRTEGEGYIYYMPRSKTDQEGKGLYVPITGMAAERLRKWLQDGDIKSGYLFRCVKKGGIVSKKKLNTFDVTRIVKRRVKEAGYPNGPYSAHSLRRGFVTEAGNKGVHIRDVMRMTGHRSLNQVMKYYEASNAINNPAGKLLG